MALEPSECAELEWIDGGGCLLAEGYRFPTASAACTTPDLPCDEAEPFSACIYIEPAIFHMQAETPFHRETPEGIEIFVWQTGPVSGIQGWSYCYELPECEAWPEQL